MNLLCESTTTISCSGHAVNAVHTVDAVVIQLMQWSWSGGSECSGHNGHAVDTVGAVDTVDAVGVGTKRSTHTVYSANRQ